MARSYANIATAIWRDDDFRILSVAAQHAYFLLASQADISAAGILSLNLTRWAARTKDVTRASLRAALEELEAHRFVAVDDETEELLVRSFVRWDNGYGNPKRRPVIRDAAGEIESPRLRRVLAEEFERLNLPAEWIPAFPQVDSLYPDSQIAHPEAADRQSPSERVVVSTGSPLDPPTLNPQSTTLVPPPPAATRERAPRGTRIPDDFAVTAEMVTWARENAPNINGAYETQKFVDYWRGRTGKDATKLDWIGTWRNWIRKAQEDTQRGSRGVATGANRHNAQRHDNPFAEV
jgi:hypothetical protein